MGREKFACTQRLKQCSSTRIRAGEGEKTNRSKTQEGPSVIELSFERNKVHIWCTFLCQRRENPLFHKQNLSVQVERQEKSKKFLRLRLASGYELELGYEAFVSLALFFPSYIFQSCLASSSISSACNPFHRCHFLLYCSSIWPHHWIHSSSPSSSLTFLKVMRGQFLRLFSILHLLNLFCVINSRPFVPNGGRFSPPEQYSRSPCPSQTSLGSDKVKEGREGWKYREVSRIGSSPPSCERKCYGCMPCQAIQVPTTTGRVGVQYANYEPEGWKCKCGPTFYPP